MRANVLTMLVCCVYLVAIAMPVEAEVHTFDIAANRLRDALSAYVHQSQRQVIFRGNEMEGVRSNGARGALSSDEALREILKGTGFSSLQDPSGNAIAIVRQTDAPLGANSEPAAVVAPAAAAQSSGGENADSGTETVVVSARKIKENLNEVGLSAVALSGEELVAIGVKNPDDLAKVVTGFNYSRSAYGTPVYTLRGIGFYDVNAGSPPAVSVYVDEIPLPYSTMARGASLDAQRVEVLKGPQGTLFGQNATGGAINYIAHRPTRTFEAGASPTYSSFGRLTADGYVSGPLTENLAARVAFGTETGGAWQRSYSRDDELGDARFYNGRLLLDWTSDDLTLQFDANGWIDRSDEQAGQLIALISGSKAPPALVAAFNAIPRPTEARGADWDTGNIVGTTDDVIGVTHKGFRRDNSLLQLALKGIYRLRERTQLVSITSWADNELKALLDLDGLSINSYHNSRGGHVKNFTQELRVSGETGTLSWLAGGIYADDRIMNYGDPFAGVSSFPFATAAMIDFERVKTAAVYGNLEYNLTDRWSVLGGIRYTDVRIDNSGCTRSGADGQFAATAVRLAAARGVTVSIAPGECATLNAVTFQPGLVMGELDESNIPFKLGVNFKLAPSSLLYATLSRGYKAGTFAPAGATYSTTLDPVVQERVMAQEAGFKIGAPRLGVQLNGALFYYDYQNKQVRGKIVDPVVGSLNKPINVPNSRIYGGELELTWTPDDHWRFKGGVGYSDSKILGTFVTTSMGGVVKNLGGEVLPLTPKCQANADLQYGLPVSAGTAYLGGHVNYKSDNYSGLGEEALFKNPAYATFDVRVGFISADERWNAALFVNNLTNKYSWDFVGLSGPDAVTRLANMPRVYGIRFGVRTR